MLGIHEGEEKEEGKEWETICSGLSLSLSPTNKGMHLDTLVEEDKGTLPHTWKTPDRRGKGNDDVKEWKTLCLSLKRKRRGTHSRKTNERTLLPGIQLKRGTRKRRCKGTENVVLLPQTSKGAH